MGKPVFCEISEDRRWIEIYFRPTQELINLMSRVRGRFVPKDKGGPFWQIPLDFEEARNLSDAIGKQNIQLGEALTEWAWRERELEEVLKEVAKAKDAKLGRLPKLLPELAATLRPDQRAGIAFAAFTLRLLIADQMGLGKTLEAIGAVFEAGVDDGPNLVVCPVTSTDAVWLYELDRWQPYPIFVASGVGMPRALREDQMAEAQRAMDWGMPFWLVVNPAMVSMRRIHPGMAATKDNLFPAYEWLHQVEWRNVVVDEVHKNALRNPETITSKGINALKVSEDGMRIGMSGTPLGGRPINLWGILNWLYPDRFTSRWRWAAQWLELSDNGYGTVIGGIKPEREEAFYRHLMPYVLRRTKEEVLKDLPPKQPVDVWCHMTPGQEKQYKQFARMAQIKIAEEEISATSILAEYTRLKQFADAKQTVVVDGDDYRTLQALPDSGKLESLLEKLDELGILEGEGDQQAVVFSQFERVVNMVYDYLTDKGVPCVKIVGKTRNRREVQQSFQAGEARVCVMTTQTGGVSITLDRADTAHILDEMWNPDDQEQAADRVHRASRIHQVTVYTYRSRDSIDEYIKEVTDEKGRVNHKLLEERRGVQLFKTGRSKDESSHSDRRPRRKRHPVPD